VASMGSSEVVSRYVDASISEPRWTVEQVTDGHAA
jgi:hypothetical protein